MGTYTYYATQTVEGCESAPKSVHLVILEGITPPVVENITTCFGEDRTLQAEGEDIRWYADPEKTALLHSGGSYSPAETGPGVHRYYVTQTKGGVESACAILTYEIIQAPQPAVAEKTKLSAGNRGCS
ncbi:MAG: hypothetical protein R2751_06835 [Bacteroidales bacterium]